MARFYELPNGELLNLDLIEKVWIEDFEGWPDLVARTQSGKSEYIEIGSDKETVTRIKDEILALGRGMPETQYTRTLAEPRYTPRAWTHGIEPDEGLRR